MEIGLAWIITTVLLPLITGATGWFTGRRKSDAEARKVEAEAKMVEAETRRLEITNENAVIDQYKIALADNRAQMEESRRINQMQMDETRKINKELISNYERRISHLEQEVRDLREINSKLKGKK